MVETFDGLELGGNERLMALVYKNRLSTQIVSGIDSTDLTIELTPDAYTTWLTGLGAGDFYYAVLIDPTAEQEVVQVKFDGSVSPNIAVERGQEGTVSRDWAAGTYLYQDITAGMLGDLTQKEGFRSGAFNPNGTLTALFFGEKFYQSDLQLWWKSVGVTSEWRLIVGEIIAATPTFTPPAGTYFNGTLITIDSVTPQVDIHYTTDGSDPDTGDPLYSVPITLPNDAVTTLKAKAFGQQRWVTDSGIETGVFTMQDEGSMWVVAATDLTVAFTSMVVWNGELWLAGNNGQTYKYNAGAGTIDVQNSFTGFPGLRYLFVGNGNQLNQRLTDGVGNRFLKYNGPLAEWTNAGQPSGCGLGNNLCENPPAVEWSQNPGNAYFTCNTNLRYWDYTIGTGFTLGPLIAASTRADAIEIVDNDGSGFDRIYIGCDDGNVRRLNVAQNGWDLTSKPGPWTNVNDIKYDSVNNRLYGSDASGRAAYLSGTWTTFNQFAARSFAKNGVLRNGKFYFNAGIGAAQTGELLKADPANQPTVVSVAPSLGYDIVQLLEFGGTIFGLTNNRLLEWA